VWELIRLANRHPRVSVLQPGPGVGGHCIAVDPWFIVDSAPELARLIRMARVVNDDKPRYVIDRIERAAKRFKEPVIACLGLSFKANIDDLRESPALDIAREIGLRFGGQVMVVEPNIRKLPESLEGIVRFVELNEALNQADVIVIFVDHVQFKRVDPVRLQAKVVIDTRGLLSRG